MSHEPQRPIFGFLWPAPDPRVDDEAVQERMLRIPPRGPVRLALLAAATLALVTATGSAVMAAIGAPWQAMLLLMFTVATGWVLVVRAWAVGTYVNDRGLAVLYVLRRSTAVLWTDVATVRDERDRVELCLRDGRVIATHVRRQSVDLLGRPEAFDMARLALRRWFEQR